MSNIRKRKVPTGIKKEDITYELLQSMIRDEVDLQLKRKMREVIQPLYQVIITDPRYDTKLPVLPEWAVKLLDESVEDSEDLLNNDENYWR